MRDLAYFEGEIRDVKNRSGKRDFKYGRERDYAFLRGRDAVIVRYEHFAGSYFCGFCGLTSIRKN